MRIEDDDAAYARARRGAARRATSARGRAPAAAWPRSSYAMLTRPAPQSISPFFLERALPEGGGTNVVNVMLVDFRAFDTIGEITVLGAVALTVYALLRRFRPPRESIEPPPQQQRCRADARDRPGEAAHGRRTQRAAT